MFRSLIKKSTHPTIITRALTSPAIKYPSKVRIVEVGARDGLQNEATTVPAEIKVGLIERYNPTSIVYFLCASMIVFQLTLCNMFVDFCRLFDAGVTNIEAGSFVSPK